MAWVTRPPNCNPMKNRDTMVASAPPKCAAGCIPPATIIPAASINTDDDTAQGNTEGVLDVLAISTMTLGGLNWLSEGVGRLAGAKRANLVEGAASVLGFPQLATFIYLLVGLAAAYYFIVRFVMHIDGSKLNNDDKIFNWVYLGIVAAVAALGAYGMA